jgi:uridine kinase
MEKNTKPYLIGIAGGSASGKTYFLKNIRGSFDENEVCIISQDNYYRPAENQAKDEKGILNFDLPDGVNHTQFLEDIHALIHQKTVAREEYMFNKAGAKGKIIELKPAPVIVVEGLFIFYFKEIKRMLDVKIFLDSRDDTRLKRRMERDKNERGISAEMILYQWHNHVIPAYNRFLLPFRDEADVILTNNDSFEKGFEIVKDHVRSVVSR